MKLSEIERVASDQRADLLAGEEGLPREMLSRLMKARMAGVPLTNYGLTIAYSLGIFERAYLELWAWGFWYAPGFDKRELDGYIKSIS